MIDAEEQSSYQDERIAGLGHEAGKASVIVINKWDLIEKDTKTAKKYEDDLRKAFAYMSYAPIIFIWRRPGSA